MCCNENATTVGIEKISSESLQWVYRSTTLQNFISHNTILPQIVLLLSKTMLIFSYIFSAKTNTSFPINLKLKEIMYLNVSNGRQCYLPRTKDPGI
jgi:hypothetical protein